MSDKTLYLVQSSFQQTDSVLNQLEHLYTAHDHIVLMGDAVLFVQDPRILNKQHVAVLENDAEILGKSMNYSHMKVIDYAAFADLCLGFKRCISLK